MHSQGPGGLAALVGTTPEANLAATVGQALNMSREIISVAENTQIPCEIIEQSMLLEIIFAYPTQSFAACGVSSGTLVSPPACLLVHHVFEIRIILVNRGTNYICGLLCIRRTVDEYNQVAND